MSGNHRRGWLGLLGLLICVGLLTPGGPVQSQEEGAQSLESVLSMLDKHVKELDAQINRLEKGIAHLKRVSDTTDPTMRQLRTIDLAGWELHYDQSLVQRKHFSFAQEQLRRAKDKPGEKPQLLEQWVDHQLEYERALDEFRDRRHELERRRHRLEGHLIERYLK